MVSAEITIDVSQLEALGARVANGDWTPALSTAGKHLEDAARARFDRGAQTSPDGVPRAPWSEAYAKRRGSHHELLVGQGDLRRSITHNVIGNDTVAVGSNLIYSATHHYGDPSRNIPARPFVGASADDMEDLLDIFSRHIVSLAEGQ